MAAAGPWIVLLCSTHRLHQNRAKNCSQVICLQPTQGKKEQRGCKAVQVLQIYFQTKLTWSKLLCRKVRTSLIFQNSPHSYGIQEAIQEAALLRISKVHRHCEHFAPWSFWYWAAQSASKGTVQAVSQLERKQTTGI